jgi:hypothetical protein
MRNHAALVCVAAMTCMAARSAAFVAGPARVACGRPRAAARPRERRLAPQCMRGVDIDEVQKMRAAEIKVYILKGPIYSDLK